MADITFPVAGGAVRKLADMGDGTHAEVVALGGGAGGGTTIPVSTTPASTVFAGEEQITSLNAEKSLAPPVGARWAIFVPEAQAVRVTLDGATPDASKMLIAAGQPVEVTTPLADVRLLEEAVGAKVNVWYFE